MNKERGGTAPSITIQPHLALERVLSLEIVRVTERAAVAAARLAGRGNEKAADQAAVDAMRRELNNLPIEGTVVIGEGERDATPMLFIGESVGNKHGPKVDIAVAPLEGTTLCAKNLPGAIATIAMAEDGTLLNAPDVYMEKIAIGPGYPKGVVDLDVPAQENIRSLAKAKGVQPAEITALLVDRPRHADLIAAVRAAGWDGALFATRQGAGCAACGGTGFRGRAAVYELLPLGEDLREGLATGASVLELRRLARGAGMRTLRQAALALAASGVTSVEEIVRVTPPD